MLAIGIENGETDRGTARSHPVYPSLPCMVRHTEFAPPRSGNEANRFPVDRLDPLQRIPPSFGSQIEQTSGCYLGFGAILGLVLDLGLRTREGMKVARARGQLRGKKPKLSDRQQRELRRMYDTGDYSVSDLAEVFSVSRPTVYRTLKRTDQP